MPILWMDTASSRFHTDKKTGEEPRVVRLAWWRDDQPDPVCHLILPTTTMTIDPATVPYHGCTYEHLIADGKPAADVIAELEKAAHGCRTIASFNQDFHWRQLHRLMGHVGAPIPSTATCVMAIATPVLALPLMRPGGGFKSPSLLEACKHFGIEPPGSPGDPVACGLSVVRAVRGVYEACVQALNEDEAAE